MPNTLISGSDMRSFYLILLLLFIAAVGLFAFQNNRDVELTYGNRSDTFPLPAVIGAVYLLGMLTGWTVVGLIKRSLQRMTDRRNAR
jgi:lipopolysaccharide assembly protein A